MTKQILEMQNGEELFAKVRGDCWKSPKHFATRQISGKFYFTNQRVVFMASGLIGTANVSWEINMREIQNVCTCLTPPCFPFGILITLQDGSKYKIGILKRNDYVNWINQHLVG